jgi:hypothetical protein
MCQDRFMVRWIKDTLFELIGYLDDPNQPIARAQAWAAVATGCLLATLATWGW